MSYDHMIPALDICDYVISTFPHHLSLLLMLPGLSLCFLTFLEFTSLQPFLIFLLQVEQNEKCREWCLDIPFNNLACYVRCFHSHLKYVDVAIHKKMSCILELFFDILLNLGMLNHFQFYEVCFSILHTYNLTVLPFITLNRKSETKNNKYFMIQISLYVNRKPNFLICVIIGAKH